MPTSPSTPTLGTLPINADTQALNNEAREQLKEALLSYPGAAKHVAIFAASRSISWNDLQVQLAREGYDDSSHIATIVDTVENHIHDEMEAYFELGSMQ